MQWTFYAERNTTSARQCQKCCFFHVLKFNWCQNLTFLFVISIILFPGFFQAMCFLLSLVCIFICLVASTFPAIHIARLYTFKHCENLANDCLCYGSDDQTSRLFTYKELGDCDLLFCLIKILLIVESSACVLGSAISFWYVILLWRSKYGGIYSGMRYSSTSNGHVQRGVV